MDRESKTLNDMRISLNWLRELVEFDMDPEVLAEALTMAGFEVEEIGGSPDLGQRRCPGKSDKLRTHPNADRLRVCQVDTGANFEHCLWCSQCSKDLYVPLPLLAPTYQG